MCSVSVKAAPEKCIRPASVVIFSEFPTNMSKPTLTGGNRRVPCVVAQQRTAACCCGVAYETVTTVTSPAHHAVNVTTTLRGNGAMERRVRGRAVQSCQRANKMSIYAKFNKVASLPSRQKCTFKI